MIKPQLPACASTGSVLLFTIDTADGCFAEAAQDCLDDDQIRLLGALLAPQTSFESRLYQDVRIIQDSVMREDGKVDIVVLASRLAVIGYKVAIRTAVGGGVGQECFRNLNYEFLLVSAPLPSETSEIIVDPKFREQFSLSQQTPRYTHLLSFLPEIYVGQHPRLTPLVKLLACEMEAAFSEAGITVPPWRQANSMMSKWKPIKSRDTEVCSPTCGISPRGALSLCSSSRSSSSSACSEYSCDDLVRSLSGFRRQESIPRRILSGFCVNPAHTGIQEQIMKGGELGQDKQNCAECAWLSQQTNHVAKPGLEDKRSKEVHDGLGLTKIRTVKLGGCR